MRRKEERFSGNVIQCGHRRIMAHEPSLKSGAVAATKRQPPSHYVLGSQRVRLLHSDFTRQRDFCNSPHQRVVQLTKTTCIRKVIRAHPLRMAAKNATEIAK
jgi:hypothetical protein